MWTLKAILTFRKYGPLSAFGEKKILLLWGVHFKLKKSERDLSGAGLYKKSLPLWLKIY